MAIPENIEDQDDIYLTEAQQKEILRRQAAFENGETTARPFEEVLEELEKLYSNNEGEV